LQGLKRQQVRLKIIRYSLAIFSELKSSKKEVKHPPKLKSKKKTDYHLLTFGTISILKKAINQQRITLLRQSQGQSESRALRKYRERNS
jgi:hypothetical protein